MRSQGGAVMSRAWRIYRRAKVAMMGQVCRILEHNPLGISFTWTLRLDAVFASRFSFVTFNAPLPASEAACFGSLLRCRLLCFLILFGIHVLLLRSRGIWLRLSALEWHLVTVYGLIVSHINDMRPAIRTSFDLLHLDLLCVFLHDGGMPPWRRCGGGPSRCPPARL